MKKASKILALVLALVLAFSCIGVSAFAATESDVVQYGETGGYLALGDSVSRGCGATVDYTEEYYNFADRTVTGSFPLRVAQAVGCKINDDAADNTNNNYWPVCTCGQTLAATLDLMEIEDGYYDDIYAHGTKPGRFTNYDDMELYYSDVCEYARQASLITVELGMCDVFYRSQMVANIECGEEINLEWGKVGLENMWEGYNYWLSAYPKLLKWLKDNTDATVVLVGMYNIVDSLNISEDIPLPIGNAIAAIPALMNQSLKQWASEYGFYFADITNVSTPVLEEDVSISTLLANDPTRCIHPSVEGNAYIARQILSVLPSAEPTKPACKTNIVVDLGQFVNVDYVSVNGVKMHNYSMDGYVLTVPYKTTFADTLTIAVKQDNGKIALQTFLLKYNNGYTAYRVYGNNDIIGSASKVVKTTLSLGSKALSSIGGLFK